MRRQEQQFNNRALLALGEALRNRRVDLLMTQEKVAVRAGLHRTYVTDIENGMRNLSFLTLLRVSTALRCALSQLMTETESLDGWEATEHEQK